jgi:hypothetical protein
MVLLVIDNFRKIKSSRYFLGQLLIPYQNLGTIQNTSKNWKSEKYYFLLKIQQMTFKITWKYLVCYQNFKKV